MALGKKKSILGLDIGSSWVKAVELFDAGVQFQLTGFSMAKVQSQEDVRGAVRDVIRKGGFKTKRVVTAVSGRSVIVRYVTMIQMSDEDLKSAIKFEADKYIPFEVEEVVLDCQKLEENVEKSETGEREMKVLLVAVKRSLIEEHVGMMQDLGLQPGIIDVDSFALGNAFELTNLNSAGMEEDDRVVALIDIGAFKTNINILKGPTSYFTREVYLAGNDFSDAISRRLGVDLQEAEGLKVNPGEKMAEVEEAVLPALDDLGNEIHLSFDYFENQFDREVDQVFVSGGSAGLPGLEKSFQRIFDRAIEFWDPLKDVAIRGDQVDTAMLKANASQLAIAVGLASRIRGK